MREHIQEFLKEILLITKASAQLESVIAISDKTIMEALERRKKKVDRLSEERKKSAALQKILEYLLVHESEMTKTHRGFYLCQFTTLKKLQATSCRVLRAKRMYAQWERWYNKENRISEEPPLDYLFTRKVVCESFSAFLEESGKYNRIKNLGGDTSPMIRTTLGGKTQVLYWFDPGFMKDYQNARMPYPSLKELGSSCMLRSLGMLDEYYKQIEDSNEKVP